MIDSRSCACGRGRSGSHRNALAARIVVVALAAAACSSSSDDTGSGASADTASEDSAAATSPSAETTEPGDDAYLLPEPFTRGITDTEIHIGAFTLDLSVGEEVGASLDQDETDVGYGAFVRELNDAGGIGGRQVVLHTYEFSPIDATQQRAACIEATQDDQVFLALVTVGYDPESVLCLTEQNHTLTITGDGMPQDYYQRAGGLLFSSAMSDTRNYREWARQLDAVGVLEGKTIGVVSEDTLGVLDSVERGLLPELEALGYEVGAFVTVPCEGALYSPCAQHDNAVEVMKAAGVDAVFAALTATANPAFVDAAIGAGFRPQYYVNGLNTAATIYRILTGDPERRAAWDGTIALSAATNTKTSPDDPTPPPSEAALECTDRYEALTGERLDFDPHAVDNDAFGLMSAQCLLIGIIGAVGNMIPPEELNAATFSRALQDFGDLPSSPPGAPPTRWEPGRLDADRSVVILRYLASCDCFVSIDGEHHAID